MSTLIIEPDGEMIGIHTDLIPLDTLGRLEITRATTIDFHNGLQEWVVMNPYGRQLFSHVSRSECLKWELQWLDEMLTDEHGGIADE